MRILVAEDDPGLRDVIVLGLADSGYHVDAVDRGDDAIDQLKFYDYDVAILDWRMPGAEGIEVVELGAPQPPPDGDPDADRARHARRPDPRPRQRRRRLPRQAVRLRRAARLTMPEGTDRVSREWTYSVEMAFSTFNRDARAAGITAARTPTTIAITPKTASCPNGMYSTLRSSLRTRWSSAP